MYILCTYVHIMYICMYVYKYICTYVNMCVYMYVCMSVVKDGLFIRIFINSTLWV